MKHLTIITLCSLFVAVVSVLLVLFSVCPTSFIEASSSPLINISDSLAINPVFYVNRARTVTVSVNQVPANPGTVIVTPTINNASLLSVAFSPSSFTFANWTGDTVDFQITAVSPTYNHQHASISFMFSGTAEESEYNLPHTSESFPVQFKPLNVISIVGLEDEILVNTVSSITASLSYRISDEHLLPEESSVNLSISVENGGAIIASPSFITWDASNSSSLNQTFTLSAPVTARNVVITFSVTGTASLYSINPSPSVFAMDVYNDSYIVADIPRFVYVGGFPVYGSVSIFQTPDEDTTLHVVKSVISGVQPLAFVPSTITFTQSSPLTQQFQISAITLSPPVDVAFNVIADGGTHNAYFTPSNRVVDIRSLESITIADIPSKMYVGQRFSFTIQASRLPVDRNSYIDVTPVLDSSNNNNTSVGHFYPPSLRFYSGRRSPLIQYMDLHAPSSASPLPMPLTWSISGPGRHVFSPIVLTGVPSVSIFEKEQINIFFPSDTIHIDSNGRGIVYADNAIMINVSLGNTKIAHDWVVVTVLATDDQNNGTDLVPSMFVPNSNRLVFSPSENWKTLQMTVSSAFVGSSEKRVNLSLVLNEGFETVEVSPNNLPRVVRCLPRIPASISYNATRDLFIVGKTVTINISVESIALSTHTMSVEFSWFVAFPAIPEAYASPSAAVFGGSNTHTTVEMGITGRKVRAPRAFLFLISGSAASCYDFGSTTLMLTAGVYAPEHVIIPSLPAFVYTGHFNAETIHVALSVLRILKSDRVTVTFGNTSRVGFYPNEANLTVNNPAGSVSVIGLLPGKENLTSFIQVYSESYEYHSVPIFSNSAILDIRPRENVTSPNYISNCFIGKSRLINFTLPKIPSEANLTLTPRLVGSQGSYPITFTPATLVFSNAPGSSIQAVLNVTILSSALPVSATFELVATGSTDFLDIPFSAPFDVIDLPEVAVSGVPLVMYPGAINTVPVTISISTAPATGSLTVSLAPTPGSFLAFTPKAVIFNGSTPIDLIVNLRATNYQPEKANMSMTLAENPSSSFYQVPVQLPQVQIRAPNTVSAALSTLIVYGGTDITITITLSTAPSSDLTLDLVMKMNQTGTGNTMIELSPAEAIIPTKQLNMFGQTTASFTATLTTEITMRYGYLDVEVSFIIGGPAAKTFQPQELLPKYLIEVVPRRLIFVNAPATMYVGLEANVTITPEYPVDPGSSLRVDVSLMHPGTIELSPTYHIWTLPLVGSNEKYTLCKPLSIATETGLTNMQFAVTQTGTVAYDSSTRPSDVVFVVKNPTVIGLASIPNEVYSGAANAINLSTTITGDALTADDEVVLRLTTNDTNCIVMNPTNGIVTMSSTSSSSNNVFTLHSTQPCNVTFNISLVSSKVNRFVLAPSAKSLNIINFRPLRTINITYPIGITWPHNWGTNDDDQYAVVNADYLNFTVSFPDPQPPGIISVRLVVLQDPSLSYYLHGAPVEDLELSPVIAYSSDSDPQVMKVGVKGLGAIGTAIFSLAFTGDLRQFHVPQIQHLVNFMPKFTISHDLPTSVFHGRIVLVNFTSTGALDVTLTVSTSNQATSLYPNSTIQWSSSSPTALVRNISFSAALSSSSSSSLVTISFTLSGPDAYKFNPIPNHVINVLSSDTIRIIAPPSPMALYIGTHSLRIGVQISEPVFGNMTVTPTWSGCPADIVNFSVSPLIFTPTSELTQYTELTGLKPRSNCRLQFILGQNTGPFISHSTIHYVTVREPYKLYLDEPPSLLANGGRFYPGQENRLVFRIRMDPALASAENPNFMAVAPDEDIRIFHERTISPSTSLYIRPSTTMWFKGATSQPMSQLFSISAQRDTSSSGNVLIIQAFTNSHMFNVSRLSFPQDRLPLPNISLLVEVKLSDFNDNTLTRFTNLTIYVSDDVYSYISVTLDEPLDPLETLRIEPVFEDYQETITFTPAIFYPSPVQTLRQYITIRGISSTPKASLKFKVTGPPRFKSLIDTLSTTLEVKNPASITVSHNFSLHDIYAHNSYNISIVVDHVPLQGDPDLIVTATYAGASKHLTFVNNQVTFSSSSSRSQVMTLIAGEPRGYLNLTFKSGGNIAYKKNVWSQPVAIQPSEVITTRSLASELMMGVSGYHLTVDVHRLPKSRSASEPDVLYIDILETHPDDCIFISPSTLMFTSHHSTMFSIRHQTVNVTPIKDSPVCTSSIKLQQINFRVRGNASHRFDRRIQPRMYRTVPNSSLSISLTPMRTYISLPYAPELLLTIHLVFQDPTQFVRVSVKSSESNAAGLNFYNSQDTTTTTTSLQQEITWSASDASSLQRERDIGLYSSAPGNYTIDFTLLNAPSSLASTFATPLGSRKIEFLPLPSIQEDPSGFTGSSFYIGKENRVRISLSLSEVLQLLGNGQPIFSLAVSIYSNTSSGLLVEPPYLKWIAGESEANRVQHFNITGTAVGAYKITYFLVRGGDVSNLLPSERVFEVLPKIIIQFEPQSPTMYPGTRNSMTVNLIAPHVYGPLSVEIYLAEGDPNSVSITPTVITWSAFTPRRQVVTVEGLYATTVPFRLGYNYLSTATVPNVEVQGDPSNRTLFPSTIILPLRPFNRTSPTVNHDSMFVDEEFVLEFSEILPLYCIFSDDRIASFRTSPNNDANYVIVTLLQAGFTTIDCFPSNDSRRYEKAATFGIQVLPRIPITVNQKQPIITLIINRPYKLYFRADYNNANVVQGAESFLTASPILDSNLSSLIWFDRPTIDFNLHLNHEFDITIIANGTNVKPTLVPTRIPFSVNAGPPFNTSAFDNITFIVLADSLTRIDIDGSAFLKSKLIDNSPSLGLMYNIALLNETSVTTLNSSVSFTFSIDERYAQLYFQVYLNMNVTNSDSIILDTPMLQFSPAPATTPFVRRSLTVKMVFMNNNIQSYLLDQPIAITADINGASYTYTGPRTVPVGTIIFTSSPIPPLPEISVTATPSPFLSTKVGATYGSQRLPRYSINVEHYSTEFLNENVYFILSVSRRPLNTPVSVTLLHKREGGANDEAAFVSFVPSNIINFQPLSSSSSISNNNNNNNNNNNSAIMTSTTNTSLIVYVRPGNFSIPPNTITASVLSMDVSRTLSDGGYTDIQMGSLQVESRLEAIIMANDTFAASAAGRRTVEVNTSFALALPRNLFSSPYPWSFTYIALMDPATPPPWVTIPQSMRFNSSTGVLSGIYDKVGILRFLVGARAVTPANVSDFVAEVIFNLNVTNKSSAPSAVQCNDQVNLCSGKISVNPTPDPTRTYDPRFLYAFVGESFQDSLELSCLCGGKDTQIELLQTDVPVGLAPWLEAKIERNISGLGFDYLFLTGTPGQQSTSTTFTNITLRVSAPGSSIFTNYIIHINVSFPAPDNNNNNNNSPLDTSENDGALAINKPFLWIIIVAVLLMIILIYWKRHVFINMCIVQHAIIDCPLQVKDVRSFVLPDNVGEVQFRKRSAPGAFSGCLRCFSTYLFDQATLEPLRKSSENVAPCWLQRVENEKDVPGASSCLELAEPETSVDGQTINNSPEFDSCWVRIFSDKKLILTQFYCDYAKCFNGWTPDLKNDSKRVGNTYLAPKVVSGDNDVGDDNGDDILRRPQNKKRRKPTSYPSAQDQAISSSVEVDISKMNDDLGMSPREQHQQPEELREVATSSSMSNNNKNNNDSSKPSALESILSKLNNAEEEETAEKKEEETSTKTKIELDDDDDNNIADAPRNEKKVVKVNPFEDELEVKNRSKLKSPNRRRRNTATSKPDSSSSSEVTSTPKPIMSLDDL